MNIKKFIASNSQEAMNLVKKDMGRDAVILKTRTIPSPGNGSGRYDRKIEVTAAMDYDAHRNTTHDQRPANEGLQRLEREISEIKETLLCVDAGSTLTPEILFNLELKNRFMNLKTFGLNEG